jgi:acetyltransferase-like isoleucine patch superfamily enzyme
MTLMGRLMSFFPLLHMILISASLLALIVQPSIVTVLLVPTAIYLFPLASFRLHKRIFPTKLGVCSLSDKKYVPWWGGHQIQSLFIAQPWLEALLTLVPGLFSLWLRAWGSQIGKGVYWTPRAEFVDRDLMDVGDGALFGHHFACSCHVVKRTKRGTYLLFVKRIVVGKGAFVSAGVRAGPGVKIADGSFVPAKTDLYPDQKWTDA